MAEPLSVATGILTILDLTQKAIRILRRFAKAPKERNNLLEEIRATEGILEDIRQLIEDELSDCSTNLNSGQSLSASLKRFERLLKSLSDALVPAGGSKNTLERLKWPFKKEDVNEKLLAIERKNQVSN